MSIELPARRELANAIQRRIPNLAGDKLARAVDALEGVIAYHLDRGHSLAFVNRNPSGDWDLTVYGLEAIDDEDQGEEQP